MANNYTNHGPEWCSRILKLPKDKIVSKARRMQLVLTKPAFINIRRNQPHRTKDPNLCNVNPLQFITPVTPEACYILGFLWADGFLGKRYSINTEIVSDDANMLMDTFKTTGKWNVSRRKRKKCRPQTKFTCASKLLHDHLLDHGFNRRNCSPSKLLGTIPADMKHYWFRGYFDGDGCFYVYDKPTNSRHHLRQLTISACYDQDWAFLTCLMDDLGVKYTISRRERKKSSHSRLRCTKRLDIIEFGKYIYQGRTLGLGRKRAIYNAMSLSESCCHRNLQ